MQFLEQFVGTVHIVHEASSRDLALTLEADNSQVVKWWVDASFRVHSDMKSQHTPGVRGNGVTGQRSRL